MKQGSTSCLLTCVTVEGTKSQEDFSIFTKIILLVAKLEWKSSF